MNQMGAGVALRRDLGGRVLNLDDAAPYRSNYIMANEWGGGYIVGERVYYHPQEKQVLKLLYNINRRYETKADRPDMRWYR